MPERSRPLSNCDPVDGRYLITTHLEHLHERPGWLESLSARPILRKVGMLESVSSLQERFNDVSEGVPPMRASLSSATPSSLRLHLSSCNIWSRGMDPSAHACDNGPSPPGTRQLLSTKLVTLSSARARAIAAASMEMCSSVVKKLAPSPARSHMHALHWQLCTWQQIPPLPKRETLVLHPESSARVRPKGALVRGKMRFARGSASRRLRLSSEATTNTTATEASCTIRCTAASSSHAQRALPCGTRAFSSS